MKRNEVTDEATELNDTARALNDEPTEQPPQAVDLPVAEDRPTVVTIETLKAGLDDALSVVAAVQAETASVRQELSQAFADPASLHADAILSLRRREDELRLTAAIARLRERQAQFDFYCALADYSQWQLGPALAERDTAESALREAQARTEAAQAAATGFQTDAQDYRRLAMRVQGEIQTLRVETARSQSENALRVKLPPRDDLNESVRRELAQFAAQGRRL